MRRALICLACTLSWLPAAHADDVRLKTGATITNVRATREGDSYRLARVHGSSLIPADEVESVTRSTTTADTLASLKLKAGDDPEKLRGVAEWCDRNHLDDEAASLRELARGVELDRRLTVLSDATTAAPFVDLARWMADRGYGDEERRAVLMKGLALEPESADVHRELGEVRRDGRWIPLAEAQRLDEERQAKLMAARGLVKYEGEWITPEQKADRIARRAAEAERAAADRDRAALQADIARLDEERRVQDELAADAAAARQQQADAMAELEAQRRAACAEAARLRAEREELERCRQSAVVVVAPYRPYDAYRWCEPRNTYYYGPRSTCEPRPVCAPRPTCQPTPCPPPTIRTVPAYPRPATTTVRTVQPVVVQKR